jgi:hypothetical protein
MFRRLKSGSRARRESGNGGKLGSGKDIQARITQLRGMPREQLADAVFMILLEARQQTALTRQAIQERADTEFVFDPSPDADSTLRQHNLDLPTLLDLLVQRSPDIRFTVEQQDAVLMLATMIREQRVEGILEGLRLAGLLNEPSRDRHAGACS